MTFARTLAMTTAAALALAACNQSPADPTKAQSQDRVAAAMAQANTPQAGQYQATAEFLKFEIPGMPPEIANRMREGMARETAVNHSYCVTDRQARMTAQDRLRQMSRAQGDCAFRNFDVSGDTVNATLVCSALPGGAGATMTMTGTMGTTQSDMRINTRMTPPAGAAAATGAATIEMRVKTRRTGDCTPESRAEAEAAEANAAAPAADRRAR